jgi:hypothetical protein
MLFIVPTRGRPDNARGLLNAWADTRTFAELLLAVDFDDPEVNEYQRLKFQLPEWAKLVVGPMHITQRGMVAALNHWALQTNHTHEHIGFMGDDHRPRTFGWDAHMAVDSMTYANDTIQGQNLPTQVCMPVRWVYAMGKMCPQSLIHLYVDNYWRELGTRVGKLTYLSDVTIEHMHPVAGKAEWDDGYKRVNDGSVYAHDADAYARYVNEGHLEEDVTAILRSMRSGV